MTSISEIRYTAIIRSLCQPVLDLMLECFPESPASEQYTLADLEELTNVFAEGTIVALDGKRVVGVGAGIFVDIDLKNLPSTEHDLLGGNDFCSHNMQSAYYFGDSLAVRPSYRGQGIARQIYNRRKRVVTRHGKLGFYAAAVLPGYADYKKQLDIQTYVDKVVADELFDPMLTVGLRNGFRVVKLLHNFFTYPKSDNWSALVYWKNPA